MKLINTKAEFVKRLREISKNHKGVVKVAYKNKIIARIPSEIYEKEIIGRVSKINLWTEASGEVNFLGENGKGGELII